MASGPKDRVSPGAAVAAVLATAAVVGAVALVVRGGPAPDATEGTASAPAPAREFARILPEVATLPIDAVGAATGTPWAGLSPEWAEDARARCIALFPIGCADFAAVLEQQGTTAAWDYAVGLHRSICAELPGSPSCVALGRAALIADDTSEALAIFDAACAQGLSEACLEAQKIRGELPPEPTAESLRAASLAHWEASQEAMRAEYFAACEAGDADACRTHRLLLIQHDDPDTVAQGWAAIREACAAGDGLMCGELGRYYFETDRALARQYLDTACRAGDEGACLDRDVIDGAVPVQPTPDEVLAESQRHTVELASEALRDAAQRCAEGDDAACLLEANLLLAGQFGESDRHGAQERYAALCDRGIGAACYDLGILLSVDTPAAQERYTRRACELGFRDACGLLGEPR